MGTLGWQEITILWIFVLPVVGFFSAVATSGRSYPDSFIDQNVPFLNTATPARRLVGNVLDGLIAGLTLGIGWLVWLAIVAPRGQSPGKAIVGTYVVSRDGQIATAGGVWARELLAKTIVFGIANLFTIYIASIIGGLWCIWDRDKQCLWDKFTGTTVGYGGRSGVPEMRIGQTASAAEDLRELKRLLDDGIITKR